MAKQRGNFSSSPLSACTWVQKLRAILLLVLLNCVVERILKNWREKKSEKLFASHAKPTWNNETPFLFFLSSKKEKEGKPKIVSQFQHKDAKRQTSCVSRMRRNWDDKKCAIIPEKWKSFLSTPRAKIVVEIVARGGNIFHSHKHVASFSAVCTMWACWGWINEKKFEPGV